MERDRVSKTVSKKPSGVFYIDGNKAFYFEQALASPIALDIPVDAISNFELINKKKLTTLLQTYIRNYKLVPKNIVILLSVQVTFDKEFPHGSIEMQKNIQEFIELVPYEEMIQRKIISSGKTRVIATNKEVCEAIKSTFTGSGFLVSGIYPLSIAMEIIPQLKSNLDLSLFVNKLSDLKGINLQPVVEASYANSFGSRGSSSMQAKEKPSKGRLYALIAVFALLMIVLGFVVYENVLSPSDENSAKSIPLPTLAPAPPENTTTQITPSVEVPVDSSGSAVNVSTPSSTTGLP